MPLDTVSTNCDRFGIYRVMITSHAKPAHLARTGRSDHGDERGVLRNELVSDSIGGDGPTI